MARRKKHEAECPPAPLSLVCLHGTFSGNGDPNRAIVTLNINGKHETGQAVGSGPIEACFNAIQDMVPHSARLAAYRVEALSEGANAKGGANVTLKYQGGGGVAGFGADANILVASVQAYLQALNKLRSFEVKLAGSRFGSTVASNL